MRPLLVWTGFTVCTERQEPERLRESRSPGRAVRHQEPRYGVMRCGVAGVSTRADVWRGAALRKRA